MADGNFMSHGLNGLNGWQEGIGSADRKTEIPPDPKGEEHTIEEVLEEVGMQEFEPFGMMLHG